MSQPIDPHDPYPEHTRLRAVADDSQVIGAFLESTPYVLAEYRDVDGSPEPQLVPAQLSAQQVLADHFDIDLDVLETEKRRMLDQIRTAEETT